MRTRTPVLRPLLAACALALAACEDAPTAPAVYQQAADGRSWVAVAPPRGLPDSRTWLPALREDPDALAGVAALRAEARRLRGRGELEDALSAEAEADRLAASSLRRAPDAATLLQAVAALDSWIGAAERALVSAPAPELEAAVEGVRAERAHADAALLQADTLAAVRHLAEAAAGARAQSPAAVALRIFARAEARVRSTELSRADARRAEHLLRHAREAILTGRPHRAFRRAAYALQLVGAGGG